MLSSKLLTRSVHTAFWSLAQHGWRQISLPFSCIRDISAQLCLVGHMPLWVWFCFIRIDATYMPAFPHPGALCSGCWNRGSDCIHWWPSPSTPAGGIHSRWCLLHVSGRSRAHTGVHPPGGSCTGKWRIVFDCLLINMLITYVCYGSVVILDVLIQ